jgi:transcriptional regulator with XRE-family HTH domain
MSRLISPNIHYLYEKESSDMPRPSTPPQKAELSKPTPIATTRTKTRSRPTVRDFGPHPIDVHVGSRIRTARLLAGLTQSALAAAVKLTFQQIQKYERGSNRVSCSMLSEFAEVLGRPVSWFFADGEVEGAQLSKGAGDPVIGERQRLTYELTSNFSKISNERAREHLVALTRTMAEWDGAGHGSHR